LINAGRKDTIPYQGIIRRAQLLQDGGNNISFAHDRPLGNRRAYRNSGVESKSRACSASA